MAGSIIRTNGSSDLTLNEIIGTLDGQRLGFDATVLTNYSTYSKPAIAAGSICEIAGSLYRFSSQEEISTTSVTSTANCTYFVELVPSSSEVTAQFSTTTPTVREDYGAGWYLSTSSNHRVIGEIEKNGSTEYWYKNQFRYLDRSREKKIFLTTTLSTSATNNFINHYITNALSNSRINHIDAIIQQLGIGSAEMMDAYDNNVRRYFSLEAESTRISITMNGVQTVPTHVARFVIRYI